MNTLPNHPIPILAFKDNYIWLFATDKKAWVVDPGEANPIIDALQEYDLTLAGILLTHHHVDHSGGILDLVKFTGNIPVYGSDQSMVKGVTHPVKEGDGIECGEFHFNILEIPGHTNDHIAYVADGFIFCGDTLFSAGCGKIFEGTPQEMWHSLEKITSLPDNTKIYCGHEYTQANLQFAKVVEPNNTAIDERLAEVNQIIAAGGCTLPSTLLLEKNINPFLRCTVSEVIQSVERYSDKSLGFVIEVFEHLRGWKNSFKP